MSEGTSCNESVNILQQLVTTSRYQFSTLNWVGVGGGTLEIQLTPVNVQVSQHFLPGL